MAEFKMALTDSGRAMFADIQTGAVLVPTKIVIGSGQIPVGMSTATMTAVTKVEATLSPLNKCLRSNDGKVTFGAAFSNAEVHESFTYRELALFCKAEYRDHSGLVTQTVPEVLYIYGNAGDSADQIPAGGAGEAVEKQIDIIAWVGNETKVDLEIASGIYLTQESLDAALQQVGAQIADVEESLSSHIQADNPHGIDCQKIGAVPTSRKINGKTLAGDITLNPEDVSAAPASHTHNYAGASTPGGNALAAVKLALSRWLHVNLGGESRAAFDGSADANIGVYGILPLTHGGTGAINASGARSSIGAAAERHTHSAADIDSGVLSSARLPTISVSKGGTGATTAEQARTNLGAAKAKHTHAANDVVGGLKQDSYKEIFFIKDAGNGTISVWKSKEPSLKTLVGGVIGTDIAYTGGSRTFFTYPPEDFTEYLVTFGYEIYPEDHSKREFHVFDLINGYHFTSWFDTDAQQWKSSHARMYDKPSA